MRKEGGCIKDYGDTNGRSNMKKKTGSVKGHGKSELVL